MEDVLNGGYYHNNNVAGTSNGHQRILKGNEKTIYPQPTWEDVVAVKNQNFSHIASYRQDLCERYEMVQNHTISLRNALQGLELRPLMRVSKFFPYTDEVGIDPLDPGLLALMLDELGRRAGFTWRNSFGVVYGLPERPADAPDEESIAFTDLLNWSIETYDLSCNWWDQTIERLELGIRFMQPWFDGSIIMVRKMHIAEIDNNAIEVWNWLRPFSLEVWILTVATIIWSGLAYMWLEYLSGHRRHRSWWQWFSDNVYLSAISFPQNYEFQPRSAAARLFGVSISLWALVMTATYTANLASLLVDTKEPLVVVEAFDDAITLDIPVCVYENTGADAFIKQKYKQARRVPLKSELETYEGLHEGLCELNLAYYQNWLGFASQKAYNPFCDLEWAGRKIKTIESGFANNADVGVKCTSLIGNVLDIYFNELLQSGFIEDMWERHYDKTRDINCDAVSPQVLEQATPENPGRRRQRQRQRQLLNNLQTQNRHHPYGGDGQRHRRELKPGQRGGAAGAAAVVDAVDVDASQMTLNQMAGTFILHYWVTGLAIVIGYFAQYVRNKQRLRDRAMDGSAKFVNRRWLSNRFGDTISTKWDGVSNRFGRNGGNGSSGGISSVFSRNSVASSNAGRANATNANTMDDHTGPTANLNNSDDERGMKLDTLREDDEEEEIELRSMRHMPTEESAPMRLESSWQMTQQELRETKQELRETKQELQQTRKEMKEQMNMIMNLLTQHNNRPNNGAPAAMPAAAAATNPPYHNRNFQPGEIEVLADGTRVQYMIRESDGKRIRRIYRPRIGSSDGMEQVA